MFAVSVLGEVSDSVPYVLWGGGLIAATMFAWWACVRSIPNDRVGVVEKLWSRTGSVGEGRILALDGEAGYQADLLRGGIHLGYWRWQYRVHVVPLVTVPQGQLGYVYARDGIQLPPSQTLGRHAECNNFQDARAFLAGSDGGQRGRQRAILREGVYAINPAIFAVMTAEAETKQKILAGQGEGQKALQIGVAEAAVLLRKVSSYGDPRLYAMAVIAEKLSNATQPLVPQRLFVSGGDSNKEANPLTMLLNLLLAEKTGISPTAEMTSLQADCEKMVAELQSEVK